MAPQISAEQIARSARPDSQGWRIRWRIRNLGQEALEIRSIRLPHSRFRAEARDLIPAERLTPDASTVFELSVKCQEAPGTVVENAFLILHAQVREEPWLVFVRFRVEFDDQGGPLSVAESMSTQPLGPSSPGGLAAG